MFDQETQKKLMKVVLRETQKAIDNGDNPFACILVDSGGKIIAKAHNSQNSLNDRTAHAEVVLVRKACRKLKKFYLTGYSVFIASEPCTMCTSLFIKAKIDAIYFGMPLDHGNDPYIPAQNIIDHAVHKPEIHGGILEEKCRQLISKVRKV